jgi:hypothetical protein
VLVLEDGLKPGKEEEEEEEEEVEGIYLSKTYQYLGAVLRTQVRYLGRAGSCLFVVIPLPRLEV